VVSDVFVVYADDGDGHRRPIGWRETEAAAQALAAIAAADLSRRQSLLKPSRERVHAAWIACSDQSRATYQGGLGPSWSDDHPSHALHAQEVAAHEQLFAAALVSAIDPRAIYSSQSFLDEHVEYKVWCVARNESRVSEALS
jgi:hypothetical protein